MNYNVVVFVGRLAAPPELRTLDSGEALGRYLVTVRSDHPRRRIDVVPVTMWDPPDHLLGSHATPGRKLFMAGSVQRRFWPVEVDRSSRLEIVATHLEFLDEDDTT